MEPQIWILLLFLFFIVPFCQGWCELIFLNKRETYKIFALECDENCPKFGINCVYSGSGCVCNGQVKCQNCPGSYFGADCQWKCTCPNSNVQCDENGLQCTCRKYDQNEKGPCSCIDGLFGPNCDQHCLCQNGGVCDNNGKCDCPPGFIGDRCQSKCPKGKYSYNCGYLCDCNGGECHHENGTCKCPDGSFNGNCKKECFCRNGGNCNQNGICRCLPGYTGRNCDGKCEFATYGIGCMSQCNCDPGAKCHHVTGKCFCPAGYTATDCKQKCPGGFYGPSCQNRCTCRNNEICDHVNGKCNRIQINKEIIAKPKLSTTSVTKSKFTSETEMQNMDETTAKSTTPKSDNFETAENLYDENLFYIAIVSGLVSILIVVLVCVVKRKSNESFDGKFKSTIK
jgi:hypothetical protein